MSEEQRLILEMLSQGKISVEEAQRLLETVGRSQEEAPEFRHRGQEPRSIMEDIVETIRTGLSNINFSFGDSGRIVLEERHSGKFSSEAAELELDVRNGTIRIESWDKDEFCLDVIKKIRAGTREQAEALISRYRFADFDGTKLRAGDQECRGLGSRVNVSLRLILPRNHVYRGRADSKNGSVEVGGIDISGLEIHTMNGSVRLSKVSGNSVVARTVNGSLRIEGGLSQVDAKTTNGSITLINIAEDSDVNLETVNGRILVQLPIRDDIGVGLSARTTAGSVRMEHPNLDIKIDSRRVTGGRSVEAKSDNWSQAPHRIALQLRSVNGSITVRELE